MTTTNQGRWWPTGHPTIRIAGHPPEELLRSGWTAVSADPHAAGGRSGSVQRVITAAGPFGRAASQIATAEGLSVESLYLVALQIRAENRDMCGSMDWRGLVVVGNYEDCVKLINAARRLVGTGEDGRGRNRRMPALPPLTGRAFFAQIAESERDNHFSIGITKSDGTRSHLTLNFPPQWAFPGDPAAESDVRIDTRQGLVWVRPTSEAGVSVKSLAEIIERDSNVNAISRLNHCPRSALCAMIASLVIYAETEESVRVHITGDRVVAQLWATYAAVAYNWNRRTIS